MANLTLAAPWVTFRNMVAALFELDNEITVGELYAPTNGDLNYVLDIEVKNHQKFKALDRRVPLVKKFGNIIVGINLIDEENGDTQPDVDVFGTIFKGNRLMKDVQVAEDMTGMDHIYVRFYPEVIQFYDDDMTDFNGNWNGLAEDLARELFEVPWNVNFCTAPKEENAVK